MPKLSKHPRNMKPELIDGTKWLLGSEICDPCLQFGKYWPKQACKVHNPKQCSHKELTNACDGCFQRSLASYFRDRVVCFDTTANNCEVWQIPMFSKTQTIVFICQECKHSFSTKSKYLALGHSWCPYCANLKLCENPDCGICFSKSFASFNKTESQRAKLAAWIAEKNGIVFPRHVLLFTKKKFWFRCFNPECLHVFVASIASITSRSSWCPYCCGFNESLCGQVECIPCRRRSFAGFADLPDVSSEISNATKVACWSIQNENTPITTSLNSQSKEKFKCNVCLHEFQMKIYSITNKKGWCRYCTKVNVIFCENMDCQHCFDRSLMSLGSDKLECLLDKSINPRFIAKFSQQMLHFQCKECGHLFKLQPDRASRGVWCKYCAGRVCGNLECKICQRACEIRSQCDPKNPCIARFKTKVSQRWVCRKCFDDAVQRDPKENSLRFLSTVSLENFCLAEMQSQASADFDLREFEFPSIWNCQIFPTLGYLPDCLFLFDQHNKILETFDPSTSDPQQIYYILQLEIIEEGRKQHSQTRNPSDETREMEIRQCVNLHFMCPIGFIYVTVAHTKHTCAHVDDVFFDGPNASILQSISLIPERQDLFKARIDEMLQLMHQMLFNRDPETHYIGH